MWLHASICCSFMPLPLTDDTQPPPNNKHLSLLFSPHTHTRPCMHRSHVLQHPNGLPERVIISAGRNRQRDHISGLLRDSTLALLTSWGSPLSVTHSSSPADGSPSTSSGSNTVVAAATGSASASAGSGSGNSSKLEAAGTKVAKWLQQERMGRLLAGFARRHGSSLLAGQRSKRGSGSSSGGGTSSRAAAAGAKGGGVAGDLSSEAALEECCQAAFAAAKEFETSHCLSMQAMGSDYTNARSGLVAQLLDAGRQLRLRDDVVHDAVLLMDRAMSASLKVGDVTAVTS